MIAMPSLFRRFVGAFLAVALAVSVYPPHVARADVLVTIEDAIDATGALPFSFKEWRPILNTCSNDDVVKCAEVVSASSSAQAAGVPSWLPQMIHLFIDVRDQNWGELVIDGGKIVACAAMQVLAGGLDVCGALELLAAGFNVLVGVADSAVKAIAAEFGLNDNPDPRAGVGNGGAPTSAYVVACGPGWTPNATCTECQDGGSLISDSHHPGAVGCRYCPFGQALINGQCGTCSISGGASAPDLLGTTCVPQCSPGSTAQQTAGAWSCVYACSGNTYFSLSSGSCHVCPDDEHADGKNSCAPCPDNTFSRNGSDCLAAAACGSHAIPDEAHPQTCIACPDKSSPVYLPAVKKTKVIDGKLRAVMVRPWPICGPPKPALTLPKH